MIIAIPVTKDQSNAKLSKVFARAPYFALYFSISKEFEVIDNPYFEDDLRVGENVLWLLNRHKVMAIAGHDFGLKLQEGAQKKKIQLILLDHTIKSLRDIKNYIL